MTYLGINPPLAALLALGLLALALYVFKGRPFFLAMLALLAVARIAMAVLLHMAYSPLAFCAVILGSFKDFAFLAPCVFCQNTKKARLFILLLSMALLTVNFSDVFYAYQSLTRMQKVIFENLNFNALSMRKDIFIIGLGLFILFFLLCERALKRFNTTKLGLKQKKGAWGLAAAGFAMLALGLTPEYTGKDIFYNEARAHRLYAVAQSSVANFLREVLAEPSGDASVPYTYSAEERAFLEGWGLLKPSNAPLPGLAIANATANAQTVDVLAAYDRVLVIFIESLAYDFLLNGVLPEAKPYGPPPSAMPFYTSLQRQGLSCANYRSSAYSTDEGVYAALASRPDFTGDALGKIDMSTIFSLARQQNFQTALFQGSTKYYRNQLITMPDVMKTEYFFAREESFGLPPEETPCVWGDTDERTFAKAFTWLTGQKKRKLFAAILTINTHPPFYSYGNCPPDIQDSPISRALFSTDNALATFMDKLERAGFMDEKTLLVITADHQITHGGQDVLNFLGWEDFTERRIPLVFISKNMEPFARIKNLAPQMLASAVDLAPTLGDLMNLAAQPSYYGKSLFAEGARYELAMTRAGRLTLGNGQKKLHVDLTEIPKAPEALAVYKWYANRRFGFE